MASHKYEIREICGDWALDIRWETDTITLFFNSRNNAELVKSILEWEDVHPNEAVPYMPTLTPPNEPLTLEQLRQMDEIPIYVVTEKYGSGWCVLNWHGVKKSYTYFSRTGTSEGMTATPLSAKTYGDLWIAYRRPPERQEEGGDRR